MNNSLLFIILTIGSLGVICASTQVPHTHKYPVHHISFPDKDELYHAKKGDTMIVYSHNGMEAIGFYHNEELNDYQYLAIIQDDYPQTFVTKDTVRDSSTTIQLGPLGDLPKVKHGELVRVVCIRDANGYVYLHKYEGEPNIFEVKKQRGKYYPCTGDTLYYLTYYKTFAPITSNYPYAKQTIRNNNNNSH